MTRNLRRLAALAALLAIGLQALWPLIAQAKPRIPGELMPICTIDGVTHYLELPAPKTPLEQRSASHCEHCQFCVFGSVGLPAQNAGVFTAVASLREERASKAIPVLESLTRVPAQPRAPPLTS